jgi:hypothetical protein
LSEKWKGMKEEIIIITEARSLQSFTSVDMTKKEL